MEVGLKVLGAIALLSQARAVDHGAGRIRKANEAPADTKVLFEDADEQNKVVSEIDRVTAVGTRVLYEKNRFPWILRSGFGADAVELVNALSFCCENKPECCEDKALVERALTLSQKASRVCADLNALTVARRLYPWDLCDPLPNNDVWTDLETIRLTRLAYDLDVISKETEAYAKVAAQPIKEISAIDLSLAKSIKEVLAYETRAAASTVIGCHAYIHDSGIKAVEEVCPGIVASSAKAFKDADEVYKELSMDAMYEKIQYLREYAEEYKSFILSNRFKKDIEKFYDFEDPTDAKWATDVMCEKSFQESTWYDDSGKKDEFIKYIEVASDNSKQGYKLAIDLLELEKEVGSKYEVECLLEQLKKTAEQYIISHSLSHPKPPKVDDFCITIMSNSYLTYKLIQEKKPDLTSTVCAAAAIGPGLDPLGTLVRCGEGVWVSCYGDKLAKGNCCQGIYILAA